MQIYIPVSSNTIYVAPDDLTYSNLTTYMYRYRSLFKGAYPIFFKYLELDIEVDTYRTMHTRVFRLADGTTIYKGEVDTYGYIVEFKGKTVIFHPESNIPVDQYIETDAINIFTNNPAIHFLKGDYKPFKIHCGGISIILPVNDWRKLPKQFIVVDPKINYSRRIRWKKWIIHIKPRDKPPLHHYIYKKR